MAVQKWRFVVVPSQIIHQPGVCPELELSLCSPTVVTAVLMASHCISPLYPRHESIVLPRNHKQHTADACAGQQHVHPDVRGQGIEEGEHARVGAVRLAIKDADA